MPDLVSEKPTSTSTADFQVPALQDEAWKAGNLASLKDIVKNNSQTENTVTRVSDTSGRGGLLTPELDKNLGDVQRILQDTQKQIADLRLHFNQTLYDNEQSRRAMFTNPYKVLSVGTGLAVFRTSPGLASVPLTGFAALQGYDDFKNLKESTNFQTRSKYTLGMVADTAIGAGALGFLSESVPMKYKAPLLVGGLLVRAAVDFIPNKK